MKLRILTTVSALLYMLTLTPAAAESLPFTRDEAILACITVIDMQIAQHERDGKPLYWQGRKVQAAEYRPLALRVCLARLSQPLVRA